MKHDKVAPVTVLSYISDDKAGNTWLP